MSGFRTAFFVLFILLIAGAAGAKEIGPNVAVFKGQDLKWEDGAYSYQDRKSTRLNSSHLTQSRMPSSA